MSATKKLSISMYTIQEPALQRSRELGDVYVWHIDILKRNKDGSMRDSKKFLVCPLDTIIHYIYSKRPEERNVYEIVRSVDSRNKYVPSKIHIDCDVEYEECPGYAPARFLAVFEEDFRAFLVETAGDVFACPVKTPILTLESPSKKKWSVHYLINGAMFVNNYHVGAIMRRFRDHVIKKYGDPDQVDNPYYYQKRDSKRVDDGHKASFVVDMSVYTKHRAFRLLGNTKLGKGSFLKSNVYAMDENGRYSFEAFRAHCIQDPIMAKTCTIFSCNELDGSNPTSRSMSRTQSGVVALKRGMQISRIQHNPMRESALQLPPDAVTYLIQLVHNMDTLITLSPFNYSYVPGTMTMKFQQARENLYCYTAGRKHSCSGIYVILDMKTMQLRQLCNKDGCKVIMDEKYDPSRNTWDMSAELEAALRNFLLLPESTCSRMLPADSVLNALSNAAASVPIHKLEHDHTMEIADDF
jgi:hypothetical protein